MDVISRDPFAIRDMLASRNVTFKQGDALIMSKVSIKFNLRTIHFSPLSTDQKPECYKIKVTILKNFVKCFIAQFLDYNRFWQFSAHWTSFHSLEYDH